jgi:hypothetical protein
VLSVDLSCNTSYEVHPPNYYILTFLNTKTFDMDLYIWMSRYVANAMYIVRVLYRRTVNLYWFGPPRRNTLRPESSYRVLVLGLFVTGVTNWSV